MAYQVASNLYRAEDDSFELLCRDYPQLWEIILLEVKEHGSEFQNGLVYRRRAIGNRRGSRPCEFHVHPEGTYCHLDSLLEPLLDESSLDTSLFLGRYSVSKTKLEYDGTDSTPENAS